MAQAIVQSMSEMDLEIMKFQSGNDDLTNEEFKKYLIESQSDLIPMYVWREGESLGASAMIYEDNIQAALDQIGGEFYILPSSIQEVIVLPYSEFIDRKYAAVDKEYGLERGELYEEMPEEEKPVHLGLEEWKRKNDQARIDRLIHQQEQENYL